MYYTGIGSRNLPFDIINIIHKVAGELAESGSILRSGGADGADTGFEEGCDLKIGDKEIYLPWKGFNDNDSKLYNMSEEAYDIAEKIYGARWKQLNPAVRALMTRNIYQVSGQSLNDKSMFVLCWTPDGCTKAKNRTARTGGTGQAIAYADSLNIPIFNLANENALKNLKEYIKIIGVIEW